MAADLGGGVGRGARAGRRRRASAAPLWPGQFMRTVNPYGFVSIQRFLHLRRDCHGNVSRSGAMKDNGPIEDRETLIARYRCADDPRQKRLREVRHPRLYSNVRVAPTG